MFIFRDAKLFNELPVQCKYSKWREPTNVLSPSKGLLLNFLGLFTFEIPYFLTF